LPADSETTSGSAAYLKISLIADGLRELTLSLKEYSIKLNSRFLYYSFILP